MLWILRIGTKETTSNTVSKISKVKEIIIEKARANHLKHYIFSKVGLQKDVTTEE